MDKTAKVTGTELMGEVKNIVKRLAEETDAIKRSAEFQKWIAFCEYAFDSGPVPGGFNGGRL